MITQTSKPVTIAAYKKANKISKIEVCKSRKGNLYSVDDKGEYLFSIAEDVDLEDTSELVIAGYTDDETGETWDFCYKPGREVVATW